MSGARAGLLRVVGLGVCLALALLLLAARQANAAKYSVAQCGWYVGADASWWDSTGGTKFRPDGYCVPPAGQDPFDGVHLKSFTRGGGTVTGTRYARWRWEAPPGTAIARVSGTWWHALHDGMQHRIGVGTWGGGFAVLAAAGAPDVTPRNFAFGVDPPQPALEDRLLCAKPESAWCAIDATSWSGLRALTIVVEDNHRPGPGLGGELSTAGWKRGTQNVDFAGVDTGAGVRFGETTIDGARVNLTEYGCAKALIGSEWRGTTMRPCPDSARGSAAIATTAFSDGTHRLRHCVTDFAGNVGCTSEQALAIDNNPPAHPRDVSLSGGSGWRRVNDFDLGWSNPDQGPASPIGGAHWRLSGPAGFDGGVQLASGRGIAALPNRAVPGPGTYSLELWLRDEAGNESRPTAVTVPLRFDNLPPGVAFAAEPEGGDGGLPETVQAEVSDAHSGPAGGEIVYRRLDREGWTELPTRMTAGATAGAARLTARLPDELGPGVYLFRAAARDAAGNVAASTRRADGTEMALRKSPPPPAAVATSQPPAAAPSAARRKTRLFAHLRWAGRRGESVTVPFSATARIVGRLVTAEGAGLATRGVRAVTRPSRGALAPRRVEVAETGPHGGFALALPAGTSRRVTVSFAGGDGLGGSRRAALALRVRAGLSFAASPRRLETGESVDLRGRVRTRGAALPRRGKLVAIQYYESEARRWRPVLVVRSDHGGRFRARYRFRYVSGTARIRLRAVALAEERWPYAPGASRPLTVMVSGR
jgi:hypothetical protein